MRNASGSGGACACVGLLGVVQRVDTSAFFKVLPLLLVIGVSARPGNGPEFTCVCMSYMAGVGGPGIMCGRL